MLPSYGVTAMLNIKKLDFKNGRGNDCKASAIFAEMQSGSRKRYTSSHAVVALCRHKIGFMNILDGRNERRVSGLKAEGLARDDSLTAYLHIFGKWISRAYTMPCNDIN